MSAHRRQQRRRARRAIERAEIAEAKRVAAVCRVCGSTDCDCAAHLAAGEWLCACPRWNPENRCKACRERGPLPRVALP